MQGSSFEVGAKVTYEGREMTVSKAPGRAKMLDPDGRPNGKVAEGRDIKMVDMSGVFALAAALPEAKSLRSLKCARAPP